MDVLRLRFLTQVLGDDGAMALAKAVELRPVLEPVLVPRAVLAWLQGLGQDFEGELPGVTNSYLSFAKSGANVYRGTISFGPQSYGFTDATTLHLAASIGVALGLDMEALDPKLKDVDLQRLGKSIDLLIKARTLLESMGVPMSKGLRAKTCRGCGRTMGAHWSEGLCKKCLANDSDQLHKEGEGPGPAAAPTKQGAPEAPTPAAKQPANNGRAALRDFMAGGQPQPKSQPQGRQMQLKLTRSQARRPCPVCGLPQFQGERMTGCACFSALAKSVTTVTSAGGYTISFGRDWDAEALEAFLQGVNPG